MKIISRTPTRLSLAGGGTDIPSYYEKNGGLVLSMAINIYQQIVMYSDEHIYESKGHRFPLKANPEFYYKILDEYKINNGLHLTKLQCDFDGYIESGIGSSASAAVALLGAINKRLDLKMSLTDIAETAWKLENKKLGLFGGKQDQYAATFGGVNLFEFKKDSITTTQLGPTFIERVLPSIVLFHCGFNRKKTNIQEGFKSISSKQKQTLDEIKTLTVATTESITKGNIQEIGRLFNELWILKKRSNRGISNVAIEDIYTTGKQHGAYGGKISGSGGGGYIFFIIPPDIRSKFINDMEKEGLEWWDFSPSFQGLDVRIIEK